MRNSSNGNGTTHYVILRDDDTNALTPVECLERLYRPFLERGLPVNLATIPCVRTDTQRDDGSAEGYLLRPPRGHFGRLPLASNPTLVRYLRDRPGFHILQHGFEHSRDEFDSQSAEDIAARLSMGAEELAGAGFPSTAAFVAPYDKLSAVGLRETAKRFRVISTGWFELRRLPMPWWPGYMVKKMFKRAHWRIGPTLLLSHPGCLLSHRRPLGSMLDSVKRAIRQQPLTVLVTHWWEYFPEGQPDEPFIEILHQTADYLESEPQVRVTSFAELARGRVGGN